MPFTVDLFFSVFAQYNREVWPAQMAAAHHAASISTVNPMVWMSALGLALGHVPPAAPTFGVPVRRPSSRSALWLLRRHSIAYRLRHA